MIHHRLYFLFAGLLFVAVAVIMLCCGCQMPLFWGILSVGIVFKTIFVVFTFIDKGFRPSIGLYVLLSGVALILISLLFRNLFPMPAVRSTLVVMAVALKLTGVVMMMLKIGAKKNNLLS